MNVKILTSLTSLPTSNDRRDYFIIGTHNGIFHSDEVVATAILCLLHENETIWVVRTRDADTLKLCDICVDVGGGHYDHHQPGFNLTRENNVMYASSGLVWKDFGNLLISKYISEEKCLYEDIFRKFDDSIISLLDCEDNGIETDKHCFSFIPSFLPIWNEANPNFERQFLKVLEIVTKIFEQELAKTIGSFMAEKILKDNWKDPKCFSNNILEIPSQTIPWLETVIDMNSSIDSPFPENNLINFVIFPYPAGGWAAQCVPPSLTRRFEQRIPFPKIWAGQTDILPQICSVDDATFCHNGRFFIRAKTKEGVIKMCNLAMH